MRCFTNNKLIKYIIFLFIPLSIIGCTTNLIIKDEPVKTSDLENADENKKVSDSPYYSIAYVDDENLHFITL